MALRNSKTATPESIQSLAEENLILLRALRDAEYVFEGSQAREGQSDKELEQREDALERFLNVLDRYPKPQPPKQRGE